MAVGYRGWRILGFRDVVLAPVCTAQTVYPQEALLYSLVLEVMMGDGILARRCGCVAVGPSSCCLVFKRYPS